MSGVVSIPVTSNGFVAKAVKVKDTAALATVLQDPSFDHFVKDSYHAGAGYSIRINPLSGEKEMMVAGTRDIAQWGLNALDTVTYNADEVLKDTVGRAIKYEMKKHGLPKSVAKFGAKFVAPGQVNLFKRLDVWRTRKTRYYEKIARANNVDVVYGHSRGGAIVADMNLPSGMTKLGLDAAMNEAGNKSMINLNEQGGNRLTSWFDEGIGLGGKNNIGLDQSRWAAHKVWRV